MKIIVKSILYLILVFLVSCSATPSKKIPVTAEVIHLTWSKNSPQASINNPQKVGNVIVSSIDTEEPIIAIDSKDKLPPETTAVIQLPSGNNPDIPYHKVQLEETLYSIAKKYNKSYQELAIINSLDSSYTIYVDQLLSLNTDKEFTAGTTSIQTKQQKNIANRPAKKTNKPKPTTSNQKQSRLKDNLSWIWPVTGKIKILRSFNDNNGESINGIDIAGKEGDSVVATGDGIVVYAGNELTGYGNLIIISHGEKYISAYAYNKIILVKEEQKIKQGQKISEIGTNESSQTKLFFQIRKQSVPVDPIEYLPKQ